MEKYTTYNLYNFTVNCKKQIAGIQNMFENLYDRLYDREVEFEEKKSKTLKRIHVNKISIEFTTKDVNPFDYYAVLFLIDGDEEKYIVNIKKDIKIFINPLDPYGEENWND